MKDRMFFFLAFVLCAAPCKAMRVSGEVCIVTDVQPLELALEYEQGDELAWQMTVKKMQSRFRDKGLLPRHAGSNVVVSLMKADCSGAVASARSDAGGRFSLDVPNGPTDLFVTASVKKTLGSRTFLYEGIASADDRTGFCRLELRNGSVALAGRCFDRKGCPAARKVIEIRQYPGSENPYLRRMSVRFAETDANGRWRCERLVAPPILRAIGLMANTNELDRCQAAGLPMSVLVDVCEDFLSEPLARVEQLLITDEMRQAKERIFVAYKSKTGKDLRQEAPMVEFPVSTNNVIYVPDIIIP